MHTYDIIFMIMLFKRKILKYLQKCKGLIQVCSAKKMQSERRSKWEICMSLRVFTEALLCGVIGHHIS